MKTQEVLVCKDESKYWRNIEIPWYWKHFSFSSSLLLILILLPHPFPLTLAFLLTILGGPE
jgi:hypothetical protein